MRCVCSLVVPCGSSGVGVQRFRGPAVVRLLGEGRWQSVSGTLGLAGQEVGFCTCSKYGTCDTVFSCRLWILDSVFFFWIPLHPTAATNRHFIGTETFGYDWSGI